MVKKTEKRKQLFNNPSNRQIEEQCLAVEHEELKNQTPEEKTFRNYKCMFCWKFLLQVGFSRFLETEDWKEKSSDEVFKIFDARMWKEQPNRVRKFIKESEEYFRKNPEEIWTGKEILNRYLPKGCRNMLESRSSLAVVKSMK